MKIIILTLNQLSKPSVIPSLGSYRSINHHQNFVAPSGAQAANMTPSGIPVLSQSFKLSPGATSFFDVCFQIAAELASYTTAYNLQTRNLGLEICQLHCLTLFFQTSQNTFAPIQIFVTPSFVYSASYHTAFGSRVCARPI